MDDETDLDVGDRLVNRQVLFVAPQQPYVAWANSLGSDHPLVTDRTGTAYLIPLLDDEAATEAWVQASFDTFFAEELAAWEPDEERWPQQRSFALFMQWFELRVAPLVFDAGTDPLRTLDQEADELGEDGSDS